MSFLGIILILPAIALAVFMLYLLILCAKALQIYIRKNSP
jgi:hypothetical protein